MVLIFCCYLFLIATIHSGTAPEIAHASSVPYIAANSIKPGGTSSSVPYKPGGPSSSVPYITVNSTPTDSINATRPLRDGESLVSSYRNFELGFFSTGGSKNRYLGIWFNADPNSTAVWVANRENPLTDSSGVVKFDDRGSLIIANGNGSIFWSSNTSGLANNPVARLEDDGNFVLTSVDTNSTELTLWQSFDHPTDTLLPGMGLGKNRLTGLEVNLSSWKATDDPTRGKFTLQFSHGRYPEMIITQDSKKLYRIGLLNGDARYPTYNVGFYFDEDEAIYKLVSGPNLSRIRISPEGLVQQFAWNEEKREWSHDLLFSADQCDKYELCGPYGSCDTNNSPLCSCLKGFVPKNPRDWSMANWTGGCIRETPLTCSNDEFLNYSSVKLPEIQKLNITNYTIKNSLSLNECSSRCASNCSCTAYTNLNNTEGDGSDCVLWSGELVDIREYSEGERGQPIYIRKAVSLSGQDDNRNTIDVRKPIVIIISSVLPSGLLILVLALALYQRKKRQRRRKFRDLLQRNSKNKGQEDDAEITLFDLATIAQATNNFSLANKLGEGGFGAVYKGILKDGQEIAVKKLSKSSKQGLDEFKNEVMYIAKLQHRNLVKILGCCIQADERMLVYEFMPNKSLDFFIFDQTRSTLLDWPKRFQIINGIARGLLYLHQDSRLRIVHRDLKGGNILLDSAMNPKISDFGLARSFVGNETEANTNKVVGTFGYMSPEYVIDGIYSTKSDVFSFGVMVLETVSGKRNRGFHHSEHYLNLLGHAWKLYKEGRCSELIQVEIVDQSNQHEAIRSIKIGLLCVQRSPEQRPNMSAVIIMLGGEGELPEPAQPGFFTEREITQAISSSFNHNIFSPNGLTLSLLQAR